MSKPVYKYARKLRDYHNDEWRMTCFRVRVMVEAEGWCMVRRPGCMPFVVAKKDLFDEMPASSVVMEVED